MDHSLKLEVGNSAKFPARFKACARRSKKASSEKKRKSEAIGVSSPKRSKREKVCEKDAMEKLDKEKKKKKFLENDAPSKRFLREEGREEAAVEKVEASEEQLRKVKKKRGKEKGITHSMGKEKVVHKDRKSVFSTSCHPTGLSQLVNDLNEAQRAAVVEIGFGSLLSLSIVRCQSSILEWCCDSFNGTSRLFRINNNTSFPITIEDVFDVFCLPLSDVPVQEYSKSECFDVADCLKNTYNLTCTCSLNNLQGVVKKNVDGGDDFKRLFVLYALSSFLTPSGNRHIKFSVCKALGDIPSISKINWSGFLFKSLCSASESYRSSKSKTFPGCAVLLQILYFHRLRWQGLDEPSSIPLIQHWPQEKFISRSVDEAKIGFGDGVLVKGLYPITKPHMSKVERPAVVPSSWTPSRHGKRKRILEFELGQDDLSDSEIEKNSKTVVEAKILQFHRNLSVVISRSLELVFQAKRREEGEKEKSVEEGEVFQSDTQKKFEDLNVKNLIDEAIKNFNRKFDWDKSGPSFTILTPIPESSPKGNVASFPSPATPKDCPSTDLVLSGKAVVPISLGEDAEERGREEEENAKLDHQRLPRGRPTLQLPIRLK